MADPQAESSSSKLGIGLPSLSNGLLSSLGSRPSGSSGRLESFRTPRDLTLGALAAPVKQKRKFEPIVPSKSKAKIPTPKPLVTVVSEGTRKEPPSKKPKKQNERKRNPKERVNFIQTEGSVFGQGQAERQIRVRDHYVCSSASSSKKTEVSRPILKKEELIEVQDDYLESAEDDIVRKMKRADFLDNPEAKASWGDSKPLTIQQSKVIKQEIKRDPDAEDDSIPVVNLDFSDTPTASSILDGSNEEIFLIQLPDCLPGRVEKEDEVAQDSSSTARAKKSIPATLYDLPEGTMGYVEVLKSGKTRLRLGNHTMYLEMGSTSNIRQELVMVDVNVESKTGSMCDLGQVKHSLVCVPDWQSELSQAMRK